MTNLPRILLVGNPNDNKILRTRTREFTIQKDGFLFDGKQIAQKELDDLILLMKKTMKAANGIGLSANQIGLSYRMFIAQVPDTQGKLKLYAVFNPAIEVIEKEGLLMEEGCLSVPGVYGNISRPKKVLLTGFDKKGKPLKIKAWGLLARVFQHEMDHLNGIVFIDNAVDIYTFEPQPKKGT